MDHGKTLLLDRIRKTTVAQLEAGAITQTISASRVPLDAIKKICAPVMELIKVELKIPGLLLLDTPGHESFTNLRKRGGNLADLAILVVDVTQGFQPQTIESIEILREYKTPFVIAANKIDLITGWRGIEDASFMKSLEEQREDVKTTLDERIYSIMGELSRYGFESERFDRVKDTSKEIAIIPVSAKTGEGIPELLLFLSGLTQKYLEEQLKTEVSGPGKGSILEVKFEKGLGTTMDIIIYDGVIKKGDIIVFGTKADAKSTKVRGLIEPRLGKYEYVDQVIAASGVKIFAPDLEDALPGSEVYVAENPEKETELKKELEAEIKEILVKTEKEGVILRADTLGSVEAITKLLESEEIPIRRADVGSVLKGDVIEASTIRSIDRYLGAILAFNVKIPSDVAEEAKASEIPIISSNIIYSLMERFKQWREEEKERERAEMFESLVLPAKVKSLPGFCFRISKPAIFGIEILAGTIKAGYQMMKEDGTVIGKIKSIQAEKETVIEARKGQQVAISMDEPTFGRQVQEGDVLYTAVPKKHVTLLLEKYKTQLTDEDIELLEKIREISMAL